MADYVLHKFRPSFEGSITLVLDHSTRDSRQAYSIVARITGSTVVSSAIDTRCYRERKCQCTREKIGTQAPEDQMGQIAYYKEDFNTLNIMKTKNRRRTDKGQSKNKQEQKKEQNRRRTDEAQKKDRRTDEERGMWEVVIN
eukprot:gene15370-16947_t